MNRTVYPLATRSIWHLVALWCIAIFFVGGAIGHFTLAGFFVTIVPTYVPAPHLMVAVSGACEMLGAIGMLWPPTRRIAGVGLLLLIVAVFPANVHMALNPAQYAYFAPWLLYVRLPLQLLLLAWVSFAMRVSRQPA